jgi:DNA-directed RNA polymerase specialized sigma24 family protein
MRWKRGNYTIDEVTAVVEGYAELTSLRYKPVIHVRLMDLEKHLKRLSRPYLEAVMLVGMNGIAERTAGRLVGASQPTMSRRYRRGIVELVKYMNGG